MPIPFYQLANELGTTTQVLREFAPEDLAHAPSDDAEVPDAVADMVREAWNMKDASEAAAQETQDESDGASPDFDGPEDREIAATQKTADVGNPASGELTVEKSAALINAALDKATEISGVPIFQILRDALTESMEAALNVAWNLGFTDAARMMTRAGDGQKATDTVTRSFGEASQ